MALNHTHQAFPNFVLENTIEDQYNSHLDLMRFCTLDNSLAGVAGDIKKIRVYSATNGTEKLAMGAGNSKNIEVKYADKEYTILLAQNRFPYYDEELMRDPLVVDTGLRHMTTDMFNTTQADIFAEFNKATQVVNATIFDFAAFVDAQAKLNLENLEYYIRNIPWTDEVSIGHAIICDALYMGLERTIKEYLAKVHIF